MAGSLRRGGIGAGEATRDVACSGHSEILSFVDGASALPGQPQRTAVHSCGLHSVGALCSDSS
eukprot:15132127-Alexandrium_andersonii.AAC.1